MDCGVSGVGLVSSLGGGLATAAAFRAGLSRPRPLLDAPLPAEGPEPEYLTGHPVQGYTEGYTFIGRWLRLAQAAAQDLAGDARLPGHEEAGLWERTSLLAAVPDAIEERFAAREPVDDEYLLARFLARLAALQRWPIERRRMAVIRRGRGGVLAAVRSAREAIGAGQVERVLVVAADSFVEAGSLEWLRRRQRLKTPDQPVGAVPGEAGACLLLESSRAARQRGARCRARVASATLVAGGPPDPASGRGLGPALGRAVSAALQEGGASTPFAGDLYADLDGCDAPAYDFGVMVTRLGPRLLAPGVRTHLPATALGETGAASAAVSLCLAMHALRRPGPARWPALIVSRAEEQGIGAACLLQREIGTGEGRG